MPSHTRHLHRAHILSLMTYRSFWRFLIHGYRGNFFLIFFSLVRITLVDFFFSFPVTNFTGTRAFASDIFPFTFFFFFLSLFFFFF